MDLTRPPEAPPVAEVEAQPSSLPTVLGLLLVAAGIAAFVVAIGGTHGRDVGDLGLVQAAPPAFWAGIACVSVAFALGACGTTVRPVVCLTALLALLVMLYGLATFTESLARFQTAWLHAGFIEYVGRTGKVLPNLDARYSWPGGFTFGAWADGAAGVSSAVSLLRFAPLTFAVLYLAPLWAIASSLTANVRARWLALWIFAVANWVGQDYLSPQALGFLLYLVMMALLLRWFRVQAPVDDAAAEAATAPEDDDAPPPGRMRRAWRRARVALRQPDEVGPATPPPSTLAAGVVLFLFLFAATVVAHQLTPVFILVFLGVMTVLGRARLGWLLVICALLFLAWLSWGAVGFWSGHLDNLVGGVGNAGANVNANVGQRFAGASADRKLILYARVGMTLGILAFAAWGWWVRRRAGHRDLTIVIAGLVPWTVLFGQAYGGEAILRAYLFAIPFLSLLAGLGLATWLDRRAARLTATLPADEPGSRRGRTVVASTLIVGVIALGSTGAAAASVGIRYGNERFERVTERSYASVRWLYRHATPGDALVEVAPTSPWRYRDIERFDYESLLDSKSVASLASLNAIAARAARTDGRTYVVLTPEAEAYGELLDGLPKGWLARYRAKLAASRDYVRVYDRDGVQIYRFTERAR